MTRVENGHRVLPQKVFLRGIACACHRGAIILFPALSFQERPPIRVRVSLRANPEKCIWGAFQVLIKSYSENFSNSRRKDGKVATMGIAAAVIALFSGGLDSALAILLIFVLMAF